MYYVHYRQDTPVTTCTAVLHRSLHWKQRMWLTKGFCSSQSIEQSGQLCGFRYDCLPHLEGRRFKVLPVTHVGCAYKANFPLFTSCSCVVSTRVPSKDEKLQISSSLLQLSCGTCTHKPRLHTCIWTCTCTCTCVCMHAVPTPVYPCMKCMNKR